MNICPLEESHASEKNTRLLAKGLYVLKVEGMKGVPAQKEYLLHAKV
jgi:hypothetical protein